MNWETFKMISWEKSPKQVRRPIFQRSFWLVTSLNPGFRLANKKNEKVRRCTYHYHSRFIKWIIINYAVYFESVCDYPKILTPLLTWLLNLMWNSKDYLSNPKFNRFLHLSRKKRFFVSFFHKKISVKSRFWLNLRVTLEDS